MAVIISNVDIPKSCDYCKFSNYHDGDDYCELFKILNGCSWRAKDVKWNEDCPLKSADEMIAEIERINTIGFVEDDVFSIPKPMIYKNEVTDIINKYCKEADYGTEID